MAITGNEPIDLPVSNGAMTPVSERERLGSIALDQWRGLALVLVLVSHGFYFTQRTSGIGRIGVNLFFFISGILVFRSLSKARETSGWQKTYTFWFRRFRRLYPALIAYVVAMLPVVWLLQNKPNLPVESDFNSYLKDLPVALLYGANYIPLAMSLGHLWSLACEMQFYFVAPLIYLLGGTTDKRRKIVFGAILIILVGLGAAQPMVKAARHFWFKYHFEFAVWPMMLGFCCEYRRAWFQKLSPVLVTVALRLSVVVCGLSLLVMLWGVQAKAIVVAIGAWLLIPCLLAYLFGRPMPQIIGGILKWLGERTYSIYLWQESFTLCGYLPSLWHPVGALLAIVVGNVWFHCFERPFLSVRSRK